MIGWLYSWWKLGLYSGKRRSSSTCQGVSLLPTYIKVKNVKIPSEITYARVPQSFPASHHLCQLLLGSRSIRIWRLLKERRLLCFQGKDTFWSSSSFNSEHLKRHDNYLPVTALMARIRRLSTDGRLWAVLFYEESDGGSRRPTITPLALIRAMEHKFLL